MPITRMGGSMLNDFVGRRMNGRPVGSTKAMGAGSVPANTGPLNPMLSGMKHVGGGMQLGGNAQPPAGFQGMMGGIGQAAPPMVGKLLGGTSYSSWGPGGRPPMLGGGQNADFFARLKKMGGSGGITGSGMPQPTGGGLRAQPAQAGGQLTERMMRRRAARKKRAAGQLPARGMVR